MAKLLKPSLSGAGAGVAAALFLAGCASHPKPVAPMAMTPPPPPPPSAPYVPPPPSEPMRSGPLPGTVQDFVVNVGDRVYFDTNQSAVRSDGRTVLAAQGRWLSQYPAVQIRIEGNADERGTREYNFALGAKRADAVKAFLVEQGVSPSRITTISYGKERPIDPGTGESAWAHNRNAHTDITQGVR
jgi:peptidoglycan-associated lipoprotein